MKIEAGKLDRKLQILSVTTTSNAAGQPSYTTTIMATVWAQSLEIRNVDVARMGGIVGSTTARYLIRWRDDITLAHRVRVDGADYVIRSIDRPDRRISLILTVEAL